MAWQVVETVEPLGDRRAAGVLAEHARHVRLQADALLASSAAVNATLFSTARLVGDLSDAGALPARL